MPVYDYECESCGPFTFMRPMAQCDRPARCPQCGGKAPRAFLTAPYFAMPTNGAYFGDEMRQLAVASLGGQSITALRTSTPGAPLHYP